MRCLITHLQSETTSTSPLHQAQTDAKTSSSKLSAIIMRLVDTLAIFSDGTRGAMRQNCCLSSARSDLEN